MAAPQGNEFWKLRLKHGRDRIIQDPDELWQNACEYFDWCNESPLYEIDFRGKDLEQVEIPHIRPYSKHEFAIACGTHQWETINDLKKVSKDFFEVVTRIEWVIYSQKFAGASAGFYNARIISQDLGLIQKQEITGPVQINITKDESEL